MEELTKVKVDDPDSPNFASIRDFIFDGYFDIPSYEMIYPGKSRIVLMKIAIINSVSAHVELLSKLVDDAAGDSDE